MKFIGRGGDRGWRRDVIGRAFRAGARQGLGGYVLGCQPLSLTDLGLAESISSTSPDPHSSSERVPLLAVETNCRRFKQVADHEAVTEFQNALAGDKRAESARPTAFRLLSWVVSATPITYTPCLVAATATLRLLSNENNC